MRSLQLVLCAAAVVLVVTGCSSSRRTRTVVLVDRGPTVVATKSGPPPHAPAHGYRAKHPDGVNLVYDSGIGVYVVVGHAGCYYHDGRYFRCKASRWEMSRSIRGPWKGTASSSVPGGLVAERGKGDKHKGKKS